MIQNEMRAIVQAQLATDLNCTIDDLHGPKDSLVFVQAKENPGRRPFPRGSSHFDMLSMGSAIVVSATPNVLAVVRPQLAGADRDSAFSMPFVLGHSLYYLPDLAAITALPSPGGFDYELVEGSDIPGLYRLEGFQNAIQYDLNHPRPDVLVTLAKSRGNVVAMAGASADCEHMWQIGIDVLPDYRGHGLAAQLVNRLALEVLRRGRVPYYGTASSNIASQRVAHRAGFEPAWMCAYQGRFDGTA